MISRRVVRLTAIIVGLLLLVTAYGFIWSSRQQEKHRQNNLGEQLAVVETAVADLPIEGQSLPTFQADLQALQTRQADVEAALVESRLSFPTEIDTTSVLAVIIGEAGLKGANLRQLSARATVTTTINAQPFRVLAYDVQVEGDLPTLSAYFSALENGKINTLSLADVKLTAVSSANTQPVSGLVPTVPAQYKAALIVKVLVRQAAAGEAPIPPIKPDSSVAAQIEALTQSLEEAKNAQDWERAISLLLAMRQLDPADTALISQLAAAYAAEGDRRLAAGQLDTAVLDYQEALQLVPGSTDALAGLAAITALTPSPTPTISPLPTSPGTAVPAGTPGPDAFVPSGLTFSENSLYPDQGCQWFGFVGQIEDAAGKALSGITVRIWSASWEGALSQSSPAGQYQQLLGDSPEKELWLIQLFDGVLPVSEIVSVESVADCEAGLIQLDWQRRY